LFYYFAVGQKPLSGVTLRRPEDTYATTRTSMPTKNYKTSLRRRLKSSTYAAGYLTECFALGSDEFLLALKDVVQAQGGVGRLAKLSKLNRESLYRLLAQGGNPKLSSIAAICTALGLQLEFKVQSKDAA
jgi:probable addiction module antidote protein